MLNKLECMDAVGYSEALKRMRGLKSGRKK
jgi:hypothetical protein